MFTHPTDDYDFLVQLDPLQLPRYVHNVHADLNLLTKRTKYVNKDPQDESASVLPGYDPAQLLFSDLQVSLFSEIPLRLVTDLIFLESLLRHIQGLPRSFRWQSAWRCLGSDSQGSSTLQSTRWILLHAYQKSQPTFSSFLVMYTDSRPFF